MGRTHHRHPRVLAAGVACTGLLVFGAAPALASGTTAKQTVSPGQTAASLPSDTSPPFGTTPADTPETVSFVMKLRGESQLSQAVERGLTNYLSVGQFQQQYGQPQQNIQALRSYLSQYGITTSVYAGNLDVVATGTAGEFDQALTVTQHEYNVPAQHGYKGQYTIPAQTVHAITNDPTLPSSIANNVTAVLGLTDYGDAVSSAQHVQSGVTVSGSSSGSSSSTCPDCQLPSDFAKNYGLDPLYSTGAMGQGQTMAIITLASVDPGAPQYFWKNVAHTPASNRSFTTVNIDGGSGAPSDAAGSSETDLDVEQSGGVAPDANIVLYQAPNTDYGFADAYFAAAAADNAGSVSTSWGEDDTGLQATIAEGEESSGYVAAFDEALLELAAQGQSTFAPAGDDGAYEGVDDLGTTDLTTLTPGDSPYTTSAGGTTAAWSGTLTNSSGTSVNVSVPQQRSWGWDYLWSPLATLNDQTLEASAEANIGGGGGGFSQVEPQTPSYQQGVSGTRSYTAVPYFTPTDPQSFGSFTADTGFDFNGSPNLITGQGSGRATPDLSADADPYSGYYLYSPSFTQDGGAALEAGWGGTSFVGPQLNGATAVIESALGRRVGFWNPTIYAAAQSYGSPFTPLSTSGASNDNLYYSGTRGTLYNEASGLGYPNLSKLAIDFAFAR